MGISGPHLIKVSEDGTKTIDVAGAWEIIHGTKPDFHHFRCLYRREGLICDCEVLTEHPAYLECYGNENKAS